MPERESETFEQTQVQVEALLTEKLNLNVKLESANRVGRKDNSTPPRPIVARFTSFKERQLCVRSSRKLKGTNIFVNEDISKETHQRRASKMSELHEKRRQGYVAYFVGDRLIVRDRKVATAERARGDRSAANEGAQDTRSSDSEARQSTAATGVSSPKSRGTLLSPMIDHSQKLRSGNRSRGNKK